MKILFENNCPINEQTADGVQVGRCYYYLNQNVCPRHGDVSLALSRYKITGELTLESTHYSESPKKTVIKDSAITGFFERFFKRKKHKIS